MKATLDKLGSLSIFLMVLIAATAIPQHGSAQIIDPLREYTNPDEIVAFNKSTTYNEAIEIINTFAQEYENKFIVDKSAYSGELGVNLPAMHWKDALEYIMRFQDLELTEYAEFYEITTPAPSTPGTTTPSTSQQTGGRAQVGGQAGEAIRATTGTREIRINATFFEGNKRALQEIGIDWSTLTSDVPENIGDFVSGDGGEAIPSSDFNDQFVAVNSLNAASVSQNAFNAVVNLGEFGPGISVQALFSAFEADNLGKVLATPSIKVVDGQEGNIQVGQDFSIKQRDIAGNVTDNFVNTGTILNVTPQIITYGDTSFVYLDLEVERSTAQPDVVSTIINKQEATTSAILLDGESTYVAGLYRTEETSVRRGIPILKDLPGWFFGLRYLFGYNSKDFLENELIIIVQAEIIQPVSERINNKLLTKRDILASTRDRMRTDLDRVFTEDQPQRDLIEESPSDEQTTETDAKAEKVEEEDTQETETEETTDIAEEEQEEEPVEDLTMQVDRPELMVVVPRAFNLEEYLEYRENGGEGEIEDDVSDLEYFIIGGSFLVPSNAENFKNMLEKEGYETRILFNPETRFNYVAFEAYKDYDTAKARTIKIRNTFNDEAWIFRLQDN
ncbi:type II and III secretion system protein [Gracilimonas sp.]|uniref:type II and III secretion system protein n=1 Tax=Gracilimonas sp. TaxID=1974203 RepID=UPI0025BEF949|nr:type II and III secretion system protein [Gracilimonas sp.]